MRSKPYVAAAVSMVLGPFLLFSLMVLIYQAAQPRFTQEPQTVSQFVIKQITPPPAPTTSSTPEPPPPAKPLAPPSPLEGLGAQLPGLQLSLSSGLGDFINAEDSLLGDTRDVAMTGDTVDQPPRATQQGGVVYPPAARSKGTEGYVLLNVLVDKQGQVLQVQVLEAQPAGVFEEAAIQGVRGWQFSPARYQGQAVKTWVQQRISFNLS